MFNSIRHLVPPYQLGFMSQWLTVTNLVLFTHDISTQFYVNSQRDVIYLDFRKAFDRVNYSVLLNKLHSYGFSENLVNFFRSYLNNWALFVSFKKTPSRVFTNCSDVQQGSNLDLLLFLLIINDLAYRCVLIIQMFAICR